MKDVQQKQCSAGVQTVFTMSLKRSQFLVKNFTDNQTAIKLVQNTYVIYALTSQIETDLTPEEIEQYKKLRTKAPTTIIENNYNTWMKATYKSTESV